MTNSSDNPQDDSSLRSPEQSLPGKKVEESGPASALPSYMMSQEPSQAGEEPETSANAPTRTAPPPLRSLGEALNTTEPTNAISVAPDGTAIPSHPELENQASSLSRNQEKESESITEFTPTAQAVSSTEDPLQPEKGAKNLNESFAGQASGVTAPPAPEQTPGKNDKPAPSKAPGAAAYPSFAQTHPLLSVEQSMPPSVLSRIYAIPAASPFVFLTLMLLLQILFGLGARSLWVGQEVQLADMFRTFSDNNYLLLTVNGEVQAGTPPLYFWFLHGLSLLINTQGPVLFFLAAGVSALLYLWTALGLGVFAARVDKRTNLAAGIMLLSTVGVLCVTHSASKDLMFAALTLCGCTALYRAYISPGQAIPGMCKAFVLAAAATLVSGPLGLLFPICAIVLFSAWRSSREQLQSLLMALAAIFFGFLPALIGLPLLQLFGLLTDAQALPLEWALLFLAPPLVVALALMKFAPRLRVAALISLVLLAVAFILSGGVSYIQLPLKSAFIIALAALPLLLQATPQRLFRKDFFIGLAVGLVLVSLWIAAIYIFTGDLDFILDQILKKGFATQFSDAQGSGWLCYLVRLPLAVLPWTLLLIFLPWGRLFGKSMREGLAASRTPAKEGLGFLYCTIIAGLIVSSFAGEPDTHRLIIVLPPLAILAARALLGMDNKRALYFRYSLALLIFLSGLAALLGTLMMFGALPKPDFVGIPWQLPSTGGFFAVGVTLMLSGIVLWFALGSSRPEGILMVMAATAIIVGYSLGSLSAPALDPVLSPKRQALMLRAYMEKGYSAASYQVTAGTYNYYAGKNIPALANRETAKAMAEKNKIVIAMPLAEANDWPGRPEGLVEVHRQWLGQSEYALFATPPIADLPPAKPPFEGSFDLLEAIKNLLRNYGLIAPAVPQHTPPAEEKTLETAPAPQPLAPQIEEGEPAVSAPQDEPQPAEQPLEEQLNDTKTAPGLTPTEPGIEHPGEISPQHGTAPTDQAAPEPLETVSPAQDDAKTPASEGEPVAPEKPQAAPAGDQMQPSPDLEEPADSPGNAPTGTVHAPGSDTPGSDTPDVTPEAPSEDAAPPIEHPGKQPEGPASPPEIQEPAPDIPGPSTAGA